MTFQMGLRLFPRPTFLHFGRSHRKATRNLLPLCMRVPWSEFCRRMGHYDCSWPVLAYDMATIEEVIEYAGEETILATNPDWWADAATVPDTGATDPETRVH